MSDALRIALVGATGLVGSAVIAQCVGREDLRLTGIARRETPLPRGIRMELFVADSAKWGEVIEAVRPKAMICALGTTRKKAGGDEAAFRAVDQQLVLDTARAAHALGVERFVHVSSVGADPMSKAFYLRVKGEVERDLAKVGFTRLDILRPGLLRGRRRDDHRTAERLGIAAAPLANLVLHENSVSIAAFARRRLRRRRWHCRAGQRADASCMTMMRSCAPRRRCRRSRGRNSDVGYGVRHGERPRNGDVGRSDPAAPLARASGRGALCGRRPVVPRL